MAEQLEWEVPDGACCSFIDDTSPLPTACDWRVIGYRVRFGIRLPACARHEDGGGFLTVEANEYLERRLREDHAARLASQ